MGEKATAHPPDQYLRAWAAKSEFEFCAWLGQAEPGDVMEYHRGVLALDKMPQATRMSESERVQLGRLASCTFRAADKGLVHLVQRRIGDCDFRYLAIARPRTENAIVGANLIDPIPGDT